MITTLCTYTGAVISIRRTVMDKNYIKMERLANSLVGIIFGDVIIIYVWQWLRIASPQ